MLGLWRQERRGSVWNEHIWAWFQRHNLGYSCGLQCLLVLPTLTITSMCSELSTYIHREWPKSHCSLTGTSFPPLLASLPSWDTPIQKLPTVNNFLLLWEVIHFKSALPVLPPWPQGLGSHSIERQSIRKAACLSLKFWEAIGPSFSGALAPSCKNECLTWWYRKCLSFVWKWLANTDKL